MGRFDSLPDSRILLRKKNAIKKELLQQDIAWIDIRIAVLGGSTTNEVVDQMELALLGYGIRAAFYQSDYGKYWEDGVFGNELLNGFKPDVIYIHTNWRNIRRFPTMQNSPEDVDKLLEGEYRRFTQLWESISEKYHCLIIQNNFERPNYRLMGNRDVWDYRGRNNFLSRLNQRFYEYAQGHNSFYIHDLDYLAQRFGIDEWNSSLYWDMYKYICPLKAIPDISISVANIIKSLYGKNKKLLVLDLDNTLWGGVIGDDGVEGIRIGNELPQGQSYYAFQEYCKELKQIGILLAVDSKNDEAAAMLGLNHPDGVLRSDDFVSVKANWASKEQNLRDISKELSLGLDSFVFIDDNPVERDIVRSFVPEVTVPEVSSAEKYISEIDRLGLFEVTEISAEDLRKTDQYKARAQANAAIDEFADYDGYLKSLQMKAVLSGFEAIGIQRIAQLTNKTNQFNLTTCRCSESDIRNMQDSDAYLCISGKLIDRFGDNGIVTVVAGEMNGEDLHIRLWLMSCRVLKRTLEDTVMNTLVDLAKGKGMKKIWGYYYPSAKNKMVKGFYKDMGFDLISSDDNDNTVWCMDVSAYQYRENRMEVELHFADHAGP